MSHTLSRDDADTVIRTALRGFASDAELAALARTEPLRTALDLDSLDFLSFVEKLNRATGVRIDESDYPRLASIDSCVEFLTAAD
ncbi:phosphopantetheine-binding protein [Nocardia pseudovaccinii]|uniref:phosphopantetheine-binding protein n=1 Tax=Nocardia pseudovaccinii TaxID=189540 RepID=UPI003D8E0ABF